MLPPEIGELVRLEKLDVGFNKVGVRRVRSWLVSCGTR